MTAGSNTHPKAQRNEEDNTTPEEKAAGHRRRKCTDALCIPVFFSTLIGLGFILHYASVHGDMARIYHGIDFHNQICGSTEAVKDKPFLFWCTVPGDPLTDALAKEAGKNAGVAGTVMGLSATLDLAHPICVQSCPEDTSTFNKCFQKELVVDGEADASGTFSRNTTFVYQLVSDHPTVSIGNRYCFPQTEELLNQLKETFGGGFDGAMFHLQQVLERWPTLVCAGFLAFVLGYAYLFLVKTLARPLLMLSFAISSFAAIGFGVWVLLGVYNEGINNAFVGHFGFNTTQVNDVLHKHIKLTTENFFAPSTGYKWADITIAIVAMVIGLAIPIVACCAKHSIDLALGSLAAALECLQDMPLLLLQPVFSVVFKLIYLSCVILGLAFVISVGEPENYSLSQKVPAGITRTFTFKEAEVWYISAYVFIAVWFYEFFSALEQFVFIYATEMWFFAPYTKVMGIRRKSVSQLALVRGFFVGFTYHLGTLALGSLIISLFQVAYMALSVIYKQANAQSGADTATNKAVQATLGCCMCCLKCWEEIVRYLNKMVYIVVSVNSESFCTAAGTMLEITASEFLAMGILEGATKFFQLGGMLTISSLGGYLTWITLRNVDAYTDPKSDHFVAQPEYVAAAATVISAIVAGVFMRIFDVVSDTILFCWALDKKNRKDNGFPPNEDLPKSLQDLLGQVEQRKPEDQKPLMSSGNK
mmetsp:Transcript_118815/g.341080  ORF Transcript_118815/g.341080 Transcript_118815/m.341080 type:complete len:703 (+) Transcript_118815:59-2167(+)